MRKIAEQIANVAQLKSDPSLQSNICIVGRPVSFTSKPTLEIGYALALEREVVLGKLIANYSKPLFGKPEITVLESELSTFANSEIDKRAFGLQEESMVVTPEVGDGIDLIDEHEPWLYKVIDRRATFENPSSFALSFERRVHELMART